MSKFSERRSFVGRLSTTATIGALALVTGACSGGEDNDAGATEDVDGTENTEAVSDSDVTEIDAMAEGEAAEADGPVSTDSETSTDVPAEIMEDAPTAIPDSDAS